MEPVSTGTDRSGQLDRRALGEAHERLARCYLERQGLRFIAANVACRGGEVDLVMRDAQGWIFVEVRFRRSARYGDAAASVTRRKQRRVINAATHWLLSQQRDLHAEACRFDVVAITGDQISWFPDAFNAGV
ncbi:YraN family protein [Pantoea sp. 1.19]|uniref:YraN family protein n=1 Tax=Pantoea sp. 1.19 TaxID=1925589 RepID=UPI000948DB30|nr:YraN family protein [Pantoea sp. 1.19]